MCSNLGLFARIIIGLLTFAFCFSCLGWSFCFALKKLGFKLLFFCAKFPHRIIERTCPFFSMMSDRFSKKICRFLKNNLPIFKLVFADFRMTQNYVYTKFKDWVLKKSRNQEFHFSLGISRLFCDYFIPRYARDEIITKQSRNPLGKVKFSDFYFSPLSILKFGI